MFDVAQDICRKVERAQPQLMKCCPISGLIKTHKWRQSSRWKNPNNLCKPPAKGSPRPRRHHTKKLFSALCPCHGLFFFPPSTRQERGCHNACLEPREIAPSTIVVLPISLSSCLVPPMEQMMPQQLIWWMETSVILPEQMAGFWHQRCAMDCVLELVIFVEG